MFFVFRRNIEESQAPVAPQTQADNSSVNWTRSHCCKRQNETVDAGDQQPANKYQRHEQKSDDLGNSWPLPFGQAA